MNTTKKSDLSRAFSEDGALKTHVGGQALLEGIMMRGKYNWSVAVREPEGTIYLEEHDLASGKDKNGWLYWPFVRGCRAFVESLALGYKALSIAAEHAFIEEDEEQSETDEGIEPTIADRADEAFWDGQVSEAGEALEAVNEFSESASIPPDGWDDASIPSGTHESEREFSWARDFGNPDEMIDGLGAQRVLEVVTEQPEPAKSPGSASAPDSTASEKKPLLDIIIEANEIAGRNGFGRIDMIEDRVVGIKSRECYECPGALLLILQAHQSLEMLCLDNETLTQKAKLDVEWANLVYRGLWFSQNRNAIDAYNAYTQKFVSGEVRIILCKGGIFVDGLRSQYSLYDYNLATYDEGDTFDHTASEGFIALHGLPSKTWSKVQGPGSGLQPVH